MISAGGILCRSAQCGARLAGPVQHCPYCGVNQTRCHEGMRRTSQRHGDPLHTHVLDTVSSGGNSGPTAAPEGAVHNAPGENAAGGCLLANFPPDAQAPRDAAGSKPAPPAASVSAGRMPGRRTRLFIVSAVGLSALAVFLGLGTSNIFGSGSHIERSFSSLPGLNARECAMDTAPQYAIVLDPPAMLAGPTRDEIIARTRQFLRGAGSGPYRVSIFPSASAQPLHSICREAAWRRWFPGGDSVDRAYDNATLIKAVISAVQTALDHPPAAENRASLAQTLTDISLSKYLRGPTNAMLVVSDLLENTPSVGILSCHTSAEAIAAYRVARRGAQERPEFVSTRIAVNIIPTTGLTEEARHCRDGFWQWFVGNANGPTARADFDYLPGGANTYNTSGKYNE